MNAIVEIESLRREVERYKALSVALVGALRPFAATGGVLTGVRDNAAGAATVRLYDGSSHLLSVDAAKVTLRDIEDAGFLFGVISGNPDFTGTTVAPVIRTRDFIRASETLREALELPAIRASVMKRE